jgi:L-2,4-diaminobutyrate decarboxylase
MDFEINAQIAIKALSSYMQRSEAGEGKVIEQPPMRDLAQQLEISRFIQDGGLTGEVFRNFLDRYLSATTRLRHPGYMAHQVAVTHPMGAVGSLIDGITNNPMAIYEMGPAPAAIEFVLINWMLEKVGWRPAPIPPTDTAKTACGGGVLTSGGSLANLTALLAARGKVDPGAWKAGNRKDLVVLAPETCHYSISRAAGILGLGEQALKAVPTDPDGRLIPDRLPDMLQELQNAGSTVLAVVANACCTAVGLYDPLREAAQFCREHRLWLHVDGAHGASALLSDKLKHYLDGIELADSLVWDAHKMLRTPGLCTALIVRDHRDLDSAFQQDASYLFHDKDQPGFDFIHRAAECTKAALGLRLFLVLASEGEAAIGRYVEEQTSRAQSAAEWIRSQPDFEVAVDPDSNIVCFRFKGADELQLEIRRKLIQRGKHYVTAAEFRRRQWLRLVIMNPKTNLEDIQDLINEIRDYTNQY